MKTLSKALICVLMLAGFIVKSFGQLQNAGTVYYDFDLSGNAVGGVSDANPVVNTGSTGGYFLNSPTNVASSPNAPYIDVGPNNRKMIVFAGGASNALSAMSDLVGNSGTLQVPPAGLTGLNPSFSVEVWALNPTVSGNETMVSWGENTQTNMVAFVYGDANFGGVSHGSWFTSWGPQPPTAGIWHHLVYTSDGSHTYLYADGNLAFSCLNPADFVITNISGTSGGANAPITIGAQLGTNNIAGTGNFGSHGTLSIARIRIHSGVLTAAQIYNNYTNELSKYQPTATVLSAAPLHRWVFNHAVNTDASGLTVADTGTAGSATAKIYGTPGMKMSYFTNINGLPALHMVGGSVTNGAYVDLPPNMISTNGAVTNNLITNAGSGAVSVEGWVSITGHPGAWPTYFLFGGGNTLTNLGVGTVTTNATNYTTNGCGQTNGTNFTLSTNIVYSTTNVDPAPNHYGKVWGNLPFGSSLATGQNNYWLWQENGTSPDQTKMEIDTQTNTLYGPYGTTYVIVTNGTFVTNTNTTTCGTNTNYIYTTNAVFTNIGTNQYVNNFDASYYFGADNTRNYTLNPLKHFVCTWNEATGQITTYVNGVEVASFFTDKKLWQIVDVNCWIGRDGYSGNATDEGDFYEYRIYNRILTPGEVLGDYQVGPGVVNTTATGTAVSAIHLTPNLTNSWVGTVAQEILTADYTGASGVNVTGGTNVVFTSSNTNVVTVSQNGGRLQFLTAGAANIVATFGGKSATNSLTVTLPTATLKNQYKFTGTGAFVATDSVGGVDGQFVNNAVNVNNQLVLSSNTYDYVDLGTGILNGYEAVTIEAWASFVPGGSTTNTLFSFGDLRTNTITGNDHGWWTNVGGNRLPQVGRYNLDMESRVGNGGARMWSGNDDPGFGVNGGQGFVVAAQQALNLDATTNNHIVAIYHPSAGFMKLYINGRLTQNTNFYSPLAVALHDNLSFIGRSVYTNNNSLTAWIDEFRIYSGVLPQTNILIDMATGPDTNVSNPGALISVKLFSTNLMVVNQTAQANLAGKFANVTNVNLLLYDGTATASSDNSNVITIDNTGLIKAIAIGQAHITATYGALSDTNTIIVANTLPGMQHRYSFNTNTTGDGTLTYDSIAGVLNATNRGDAYESNGFLILDTNNFTINGSNSWLSMPQSTYNPLNIAFSLEYWAAFAHSGGASDTNAANADVYGFGDTDTNTGFGEFYINHSANNGSAGNGNAAFHINPTDPATAGTGEVSMTASPKFDGRTNEVHVAVVYHPLGGYQLLYTNGILAVSNAINTGNVNLSLISTNQALLGKPLYTANAYTHMQMDEFRVYSGVITPDVAAIDYAAGPNTNINVATNPGALGALNQIRLVVNSNMIIDGQQTAQIFADWANVGNVNLGAYAVTNHPVLTNNNTTVLTVNSNTWTVAANNPGVATLSTGYSNKTASAQITVGYPPGFVSLWHRFSFNDAANSTTVHDSVGGMDGLLQGNAHTTGAGELVTDGVGSVTGGYVAPGAQNGTTGGGGSFVVWTNNLINTLSNATFDIWVAASNSTAFVRMFDIGGDTDSTADAADTNGLTNTYFAMVGVYAANGPISWAIKPTNSGQQYDPANYPAAGPYSTNGYMHITLTYNQSAGVSKWYTNGVLSGNPSTIPFPLSSVRVTTAYIGRSHYVPPGTTDPMWAGRMDEFRIWTNTMSAAEVLADQNAGPNALPSPSLTIVTNGTPGQYKLTYDTWASRYNISLQQSPTAAPTSWTPVGGVLTTNTNQTISTTITVGPGNKFFRLQ